MTWWRPLSDPPTETCDVLIVLLRERRVRDTWEDVQIAVYEPDDRTYYMADDEHADPDKDVGYWYPLPPLPPIPARNKKFASYSSGWPTQPGWHEVIDIRSPDASPTYRYWNGGAWSPPIPDNGDGRPSEGYMQAVLGRTEGIENLLLTSMRFKLRPDLT